MELRSAVDLAGGEAVTAAREESAFVRRSLRRAFALRLALAVALEITGWSTVLAPDEQTYVAGGRQLAAYWKGDLLVSPRHLFDPRQPVAYFLLNGLSFYMFGGAFPLKIVNCLVGSLSCLLIFRLASALFGPLAARRATTLAVFFPSLVLWSALNIRDVWVILLILFISLKSHQVVVGRSHQALLQLAIATYAVTFFRQYLFFVVAIPPLVALLIGRRGQLGRNFVVATLASIAVVVFVQQGAATTALGTMDLETLAEQRRGMLFKAGSAFAADADISSPGKALAFLPIGMAYFLFAPFPWQITSLLKALALPEMLLTYWLVPAIYRGAVWTIRHRFRDGLQVLLLTGLLTVSYALGSGNVGTLYRHRAQAFVFFLIFAGVGQELAARHRPERSL